MERKNDNIDKKTLNKIAEELVKDFRQLDICTEEEITSSWQKVRTKTGRRRLSYYRYASIAACLAIGLLIFLYYSRDTTSGETINSLLAQQVFPEMHIPGKICLFRDGEKTLLSGNATIDLRSPNQIYINGNTVLPLSSRPSQLIVPKGKRGIILLTDGSRVDINAGSRVIFTDRFTDHNREIAVEGEVCLKVSKDEQHPFLVHTADFKVRVLGTLFNVCTSENSNRGNVVLAQGIVELQTQKEKIQLSPSEQAIVTPNSIIKRNVEAYPFLCWKDGIIILDNRKVSEIITQLSKYYGNPILCDTTIQNLELGGKLSLQEDLATTLNILCEVSGFKAEMKDNTFYLKAKE